MILLITLIFQSKFDGENQINYSKRTELTMDLKTDYYQMMSRVRLDRSCNYNLQSTVTSQDMDISVITSSFLWTFRLNKPLEIVTVHKKARKSKAVRRADNASFSCVLPTFQVLYCAGKPTIERVVYCCTFVIKLLSLSKSIR